MSNKLTIFFIAFEFPPLNIAGVYRPLRFVNALAQSGYRVIVITVSLNDNLLKLGYHIDYDLLKMVHYSVEIIRIPINDVSLLTNSFYGRFKHIINNAAGDNFLHAWKPQVYNRVATLVNLYDPGLIFATCPPFSMSILAKMISKKYGLPLIIDLRDSWSDSGMRPMFSLFHYLRRKSLERSVLSQSSLIFSVTPQLITRLKKNHKKINKSKFKVVFNSPNFDFCTLKSVHLNPIINQKILNIGYTGSFYFNGNKKLKPWWRRKPMHWLHFWPTSEDWAYRSPLYFFKCLSLLFKRNPNLQNNIYFNYIGLPDKWLYEMVKEYSLESNVIFHGYKSQNEVQKLESTFDLLLLTSEKVLKQEHYCLPSKIFTYIISGKPIIAFVTKGIQREFITNSGLGLVFDPDDIADSVIKMESLLINGFNSAVNNEYLEQFSNELTSQNFIKYVKSIY